MFLQPCGFMFWKVYLISVPPYAIWSMYLHIERLFGGSHLLALIHMSMVPNFAEDVRGSVHSGSG
jgi:hypothetical protein